MLVWTVQDAPWAVASPTLYRYLPKQYVDDFFRDGSLMLSSFSKFKEHKDEQRLDEREGQAHITVMLNYSNGQTHTTMAEIETGRDAYVLCAAMHHEPTLMEQFECDSYIRIDNPIKFAEAVSRKIPGFRRGIEGACHYVTRKRYKGNVDKAEQLQLMSLPKDSSELRRRLEKMMLSKVEHFPLFMKDRSYAHQSEYRLLWSTRSVVTGHLLTKVPEAREFCGPPNDFIE